MASAVSKVFGERPESTTFALEVSIKLLVISSHFVVTEGMGTAKLLLFEGRLYMADGAPEYSEYISVNASTKISHASK